MTTCQPASANRRAMTAPMRLAPPVTRTAGRCIAVAKHSRARLERDIAAMRMAVIAPRRLVQVRQARKSGAMAGTLCDMLWDSHVVAHEADGVCLLYIDRMLRHEVSSPQAFTRLAARG